MKAQVKIHNGTPTLFLNDRPVYANCQLLGSLDPNYRDLNRQLMQEYAKAGVHIYSIDSVGPEWCGPRPGQPGHFDFTATAPRLQEVLDADPDALFLLRMGFETRWVANNWWNQLYPDEVEILSDGQRLSASFASTVWQDEVKALLTAYIDHLRSTGLYDRVIAYQIAAGTCGEWIKDWSSMDLACGDYSEPMRRAFRAWLRRQYAGDASRLQAAWGDPSVTGKAAGNDILRRKKSLPLLHALGDADVGADLAKILERADFGAAELPTALALLDAAGSRAYAATLMESYYAAGLSSLQAALGERAEQSLLGSTAQWLMQRNS